MIGAMPFPKIIVNDSYFKNILAIEQEKHSNPDISEQFEGEGTTTGASASNTLSSDTSEDTDTELMGFNVNIRELPLKWRP